MTTRLPVTISPLEDAVARMSAKTPVGSMLKSADWERVPLALRERAFFSAQVESARLLSEMERKLQARLAMAREAVARGEAFVDRSSFIGDMRKIAAEIGIEPDPALRGGLQDITSRKRLGLIFDIQDEQAKEYARWKAEQDPDILDAFPCQELIRIMDRKVPRDWQARWVAAGGRLFEGRMIARKDDPIWRRISRFGVPWPPFDFGSGMGLEDVGRDEAEMLGVIAVDDQVPPQEEDFNAELQASTRGISPRFVEALKRIFGDQVREADGALVWRGNLIGDFVDQALQPGLDPSRKGKKTISLGSASPAMVQAAKEHGLNFEGADFLLTEDTVAKVWRDHGPEGERRRDQRPLSKLDFQLLPEMWRNPGAVLPSKRPRRLELSQVFAGKQLGVAWQMRPDQPTKVYLVTLYAKKEAEGES